MVRPATGAPAVNVTGAEKVAVTGVPALAVRFCTWASVEAMLLTNWPLAVLPPLAAVNTVLPPEATSVTCVPVSRLW